MPEDRPIRVLHLRSSCGFYGAEGVIYTLVHARAGDSMVACFADARETHTELCERLSREGRETRRIPTRGAVDLRVPGRFAAIVRRWRPDVVHCHDYKSAAVAVFAGCHRKAVLVFTVHGDLRDTVGSTRLASLGQWALRRFDAVVGVSRSTVEVVQGYGVAAARTRLVPNAVDTRRFRLGPDRKARRDELGIPPDGVLIGAVGRLSPEKGHDVLLDAVSRLKCPWRLVLAGDGPLLAALRIQAAERGIGDRVHFLGSVDDILPVYEALDILVLPSHHEGLPLVVAEAAACGLPVAATAVGDVDRVVLEGQTGLLSPPGDAAALAASLERLAGDEALREEYGAAGRLHVERSFSAPAMAEAYEAVYREVARR